MKNLIYQYWDTMGSSRAGLSGVKASWENIKQYADRIGADHLTEENPPHLHGMKCSLYYGTFNPVFREEFHEYDNVLFLDSDNHAVDGLEESIFDGFEADIGIINDPLQDRLRATTRVGKLNRKQDNLWAKAVEKRWGITLPRTEEGYLKHLNSGLVLYSNKGMLKAKREFLPFAEYIKFIPSIRGLQPFYYADQSYLHVTLLASRMDFVELDISWNVYVSFHEKNFKHVIFNRKKDSKIIHPFGIPGIHNWSRERLWELANLPVEKWEGDFINVTDEVKKSFEL